jgi:hypothetical protein
MPVSRRDAENFTLIIKKQLSVSEKPLRLCVKLGHLLMLSIIRHFIQNRKNKTLFILSHQGHTTFFDHFFFSN